MHQPELHDLPLAADTAAGTPDPDASSISGGAADPERGRLTLVASMSHDLQQPLTAIKIQAQLLQRATRAGPALSADDYLTGLARIIAETNRMAAQLKQLLDLSNAPLTGPVDVVRRPADLVALVRAAVGEHQRDSQTNPVALATTEPTLVALVDADRIRRVLDNLLGNAIKYGSADRAVIARLERIEDVDGPYAVLQIRDQGVGIPAADLPHVTERFYRGRNVAGIVAGTGIGLADALHTVVEHGGRLTLDSTEGVGTTVTVRLPLALPVDATPTTGQPSAGWESNPTGADRQAVESLPRARHRPTDRVV